MHLVDSGSGPVAFAARPMHGRTATAELETRQMTDGSWSDYVADAGTDPTALSDASGSMADAIGAADSGFDSIDTSTLAEATADDVASAATNVDEAAGWQQWADGDLATAASWQDEAAGYVQSANEWAAWGNADAAQEALYSAENASGIADDVAGTASTDLSIGAGYMDSASSDLSSAGSDSTE
jgi:hypothetical protein